MKKIFLYLIFITICSSCVSTKQTTYFQGEPVSKSDIYKLNNEPYRLQVNDILYIDIKAENPEIVSLFKSSGSNDAGGAAAKGEGLYFTGYTVDRHGNIRIPYIGDLNVLGYTEKEIREKIEVELAKFLKNPEAVFVTVKLAGIKFVATGEVGSPGTINLMQNEVTIIDAIANAGEISEMGNRQEVIVIRKSLDGVKKYKLDFTKIAIFESDNFYIQPNDIIYVPPLKQKSWGTGTTGLQTFSTAVTILSFLVSSVLLVKNL
ncbi:polysaccharide biosynthesis/export family protein [Lutibacter maritimus]|uniref:Protein involved in gliding motility EpsA n=1 Tax=Lutibacter maritimus TaxID=593133 RepID=A0A1I6NTI9_9FLAO|nr:polysaccharide biosynthesis/export family protein [Lutibacter maritimus]SFS31194.1 protein involved in gliding motility EpsA [Lutibacter maritimus]